jgi:hypothetical protein
MKPENGNALSEAQLAELARVQSIKLLSCPFCGQAVTITDCNYYGWHITHRSGNDRICRMLDLSAFNTPDEAAKDWNDRQDNDRTQRRIPAATDVQTQQPTRPADSRSLE